MHHFSGFELSIGGKCPPPKAHFLHLELTKHYCVNGRRSAVTMLIRLSSYATWSTSETVVSVQLPLNSMFFCLAEVLSHMTPMQLLYRLCSHSCGQNLDKLFLCSLTTLIFSALTINYMYIMPFDSTPSLVYV